MVPVFNTARYLEECIESILAQTYTDFELIVVDDASHDNSVEIVGKYSARDSRVRLLHNEVNL